MTPACCCREEAASGARIRWPRVADARPPDSDARAMASRTHHAHDGICTAAAAAPAADADAMPPRPGQAPSSIRNASRTPDISWQAKSRCGSCGISHSSPYMTQTQNGHGAAPEQSALQRSPAPGASAMVRRATSAAVGCVSIDPRTLSCQGLSSAAVSAARPPTPSIETSRAV